MGDLRCGDLVEVEWESDWYPGVVSDIPKRQELAVNYVNGDFEESVPASAGRLRSFPLRKRPGDDVRKGSRDRKAVAAAKLRLGGNRGDIGIVMEALAEGADPCTFSLGADLFRCAADQCLCAHPTSRTTLFGSFGRGPASHSC